MTKKINFRARDPYGFATQPRPVPAASLIPDWFRNMKPYHTSPLNPEGTKVIVENLNSNASAKKCTPMLDALTTGYIATLWADVQVRRLDKNFARVTWKVEGQAVFEEHGESSRFVTPPPGYSTQVFKYINTWIPQTPPGYSVLITSPFGYRDLPFQAIPAVIDTDKSHLEIVPPMWIKDDFEGIVEKGTPMFQVTPFKRENWEATFDSYKENEYNWLEDRGFNSTIVSHYIKNVWSKKSYK